MIAQMHALETTRFGRVELSPQQLLTFPERLIGFDGHDYALVSAGHGPFVWLQSLSTPEVALPLTPPQRFFADFELELDPMESDRLGVDPAAIEEVFVTVRAVPVAAECTANTRAPIVVLAAGGDGPRQAFQVLNRSAGVQLRAPLFPGR